MAPTTTSGVNPAPLYKEKANAISALMARHTTAPSLSFLSSLPPRGGASSAPTNSAAKAPHTKTANQVRAQDEDFELDRTAQYDDNMGVGMFAPENRREREEKRKKEGEDRRLKARLGIKDKRRGSEWEGVSGLGRARGAESEDEEELGRSGVGRAKKRKRIAVEADVEENNQTRNSKGDVTTAHTPSPTPLPVPGADATPNSLKNGDDAKGIVDEDSNTNGGSATADHATPDSKTRQRRKKKKKKSKDKTEGVPATSSHGGS